MTSGDGSRRRLPSVDAVLQTESLRNARSTYAHAPLISLIRAAIQRHRDVAGSDAPPPTAEDVGREVRERIERDWRASPGRVINATGVILHTNLGRSPLSEEAVEAVRAAAGYSDVEFNLGVGKRANRQERVADLLRTITGAEAAHVAVNNAAAVTLALSALARGREVLVSRGEAVEIGGGFRIPTILRQSGARLVEVGTTNRTRLADYEEAITERTAAILRVHTSNFRIVGFAARVPLPDLGALARARGVFLIDDNGSGALLDTAAFGLAHEPTPMEALAAGAHLVAFSGDKLLGGPQSGLLLGDSATIGKIGKHPLARATRPDKLALAALSATLLAYLRGDAPRLLPIWRMISVSTGELQERAEKMVDKLKTHDVDATTLPGESTIGGGSLPGETLPTMLIALPHPITASSLRAATPPVVGRTHERRVLLDLRTILPEEEAPLLAAVRAARSYSGR